MSIVFASPALASALDSVVSGFGSSVNLAFYSNDVTPTASSTSSTFSSIGSPQTLSASNWAAAATSNGETAKEYNSTVSGAPQGGPGSSVTIYGYYVFSSNGNLIYAERFDSPRTATSSQPVVITPKLTAESIPSA